MVTHDPPAVHHSWRRTPPRKGERVRMVSDRHRGRLGTVVESVWIQGGGAGMRQAWLVRLDATSRAAERVVRCYSASFVPVDRRR